MRLRFSELSRRTVRELQFLASNLGVNTTGCIEKPDLVDRILATGRVEIAPEVTSPELANAVLAQELQDARYSTSASSDCVEDVEGSASSAGTSPADMTTSVSEFDLPIKRGITRCARTAPALMDISAPPDEDI